MPSSTKRRTQSRRRPGEVRDAIMTILSSKPRGASILEIEEGVRGLIGDSASSSIRSYLRLNSDSLFRREDRGIYSIRETAAPYEKPILGTRNGSTGRVFEFG